MRVKEWIGMSHKPALDLTDDKDRSHSYTHRNLLTRDQIHTEKGRVGTLRMHAPTHTKAKSTSLEDRAPHMS